MTTKDESVSYFFYFLLLGRDDAWLPIIVLVLFLTLWTRIMAGGIGRPVLSIISGLLFLLSIVKHFASIHGE